MDELDLLRERLTEYVSLEFGLAELDSTGKSHAPPDLRYVGVVDLVAPHVIVFRFEFDGDSYSALAGSSMSYLPARGMTHEQLASQIFGANWLGERDPVDLNTSRIGDDAVPPTLERRLVLQALATELRGPHAVVAEGLFLRMTQEYVALIEADGEGVVIGTSIPAYPVGFAEFSKWRRLALAVGEHLRGLR